MSQSRRRQFLIASGALLGAPIISFAQSPQKVRRIGYLGGGLSGADFAQSVRRQIFEFLQRAGYEDGKNLKIEWRYAEGKVERLAGLAEELVRLNVELIVAALNDSVVAAKRATQTIPIVMANVSYPVELGFVQSLARPGGNITGAVWQDASETADKLYQLLKYALPHAKRVAVLWNPVAWSQVWNEERMRRQDHDLAAIGISLIRIGVARPEELTAALDQIAAKKADALQLSGDPVLASHFKDIADFARQRKIASISGHPGYVSAGGLLHYGPDLAAMTEKAASYIVKILRGAKPADLPAELATKYELTLNERTARAIGFKPPHAFMVSVTRQVE